MRREKFIILSFLAILTLTLLFVFFTPKQSVSKPFSQLPPVPVVINTNQETIVPQPQVEITRIVHPETVIKELAVPFSKNVIQLITKDEFRMGRDSFTEPWFEEILRLKSIKGTSVDIFYSESGGTPQGIDEESVQVSPLGGYLLFKMQFYEGSQYHLVNLKNRQEILPEGINPVFFAWGPNETFIAVSSETSDFDGSGSNGVYILTGPSLQEKRKVFAFRGLSLQDDSNGMNPDIEAVIDLTSKDDFVYFTAVSKLQKNIHFSYDVKSEILNRISP